MYEQFVHLSLTVVGLYFFCNELLQQGIPFCAVSVIILNRYIFL